MPSTHLPLGPLKPNAQTRPPPPPEGASRWRTNLARGAEARAYESVESDFVTKLLAFLVQGNLKEHKKLNPEFGVSDVLSPFSFEINDHRFFTEGGQHSPEGHVTNHR